MCPVLPVQVNVRTDDGEPERGELVEHGSESQGGRLCAGPGGQGRPVSPERPEPDGSCPARHWPLLLHALMEKQEPQPLGKRRPLWFVRQLLGSAIRDADRRAWLLIPLLSPLHPQSECLTLGKR